MMAITTIQLGDKPYTSPYYSIGKEICKNLYIELSTSSDSKSSYYLLKIPGMQRIIEGTNTNPCRGLFTASNGRSFAVNGFTLYELFQNGSRSEIGSLISTSGPVRFAENSRQMILVDGRAGYIFDFTLNNFKQILDEAFPGINTAFGPTHVSCIDTYFIVNNPLTNEYYWSNSYYKYATDTESGSTNFTDYDPNVINGYWSFLQFGAKIGKTDIINALVDCQNMLWLFGNNSIEVHYDTGDINQLFARYNGALIEVGTMASNSVATYNQNVFWLASDKTGFIGIYSNEGLVPKKISTRGIEQIISSMQDYTNCQSYCYTHAGHTFYVINFLRDDRTFCYDLVTNSWHERTYLDSLLGVEHRHRANFTTYNWNINIIGDSISDAYYFFNNEKYLNDDSTGTNVNYIACEKTTPIGFNQGLKNSYRSFQLVVQQGVGINNGLTSGYNQEDPDIAFEKYPKALISWSDDCGVTYKGTRQLTLGAMGNYAHRSKLVQLGASRNRVWKIRITEPVQVILVGIIVDVVPMLS